MPRRKSISPILTIEVLPPKPASVTIIEERKSTNNPKLEAWYAVRQEWIDNDGHVTPELVTLESEARKAVDTRYVSNS